MFVEVNDLQKSYGEGESRFKVLKGLNLSINKGEFVVILGPSGCGKSTFLNILGGIDTPDEGFIEIDGEKLLAKDEASITKYRRRHLGFVFQTYNLIPNLTVKENIQVGEYLSENPLNIDDVIDSLGLTQHVDKLPNQLSGGQQQRVSIGRAIIKNPDILLADEPTGALDYKTSKDILGVFEKINQQYGATIVMVTHNVAIKYMADRIITLKDGEVLSNVENHHKIPAISLTW